MSCGINLFIFLMISGAIVCLAMAIGELRKLIGELRKRIVDLEKKEQKLKSEIHNIVTYLKGESDKEKTDE